MLEIPPVDSAKRAVQVQIVKDVRNGTGELNERQKAVFVGLLFSVFWAVFREAVHAHDSGDKISGGAIAVEVVAAFAFGYIVTVFRKRRK